MLSAGTVPGEGWPGWGSPPTLTQHTAQCHCVCTSVSCVLVPCEGRKSPTHRGFFCNCSGNEWLGISKIGTALTILVARIVPSGWHAYTQSRKVLLVYHTVKLFRSSCFPCKKLREGANQGTNIKGPFSWTPHVRCSSSLRSLHSHKRIQKAEILSK